MRSPMLRRVGGLVFDLVLVAAIALGVYFRYSWTNWNQDTNLHPDEYGLTGTLTRLQIPETVKDWFNTRASPISPYARYDEVGNRVGDGPDNAMRWGQWPIILLKWGAELTDNTGYTEQRLFGRQMSATADLLAVLIIIVIGWRLYSLRHGLLAGALSALAVMEIQQSHFMTSDTFAVAFTALTMWMAVEVALSRPKRGAIPSSRALIFAALFGVFGAMAVASRVNLVPLLALIGVAGLIAAVRAQRPPSPEEPAGLRALLAVDWRPIVVLCALAAATTLITFRLVHPMSFRAATGDTTILTLTPNPDWLNALALSAAESSLKGGGPPAEQWTGRTPILFPWLNMVLWGMGLPLGLTAWAGLLWMAWRSLIGAGAAAMSSRRWADADAGETETSTARNAEAVFGEDDASPVTASAAGADGIEPAPSSVEEANAGSEAVASAQPFAAEATANVTGGLTQASPERPEAENAADAQPTAAVADDLPHTASVATGDEVDAAAGDGVDFTAAEHVLQAAVEAEGDANFAALASAPDVPDAALAGSTPFAGERDPAEAVVALEAQAGSADPVGALVDTSPLRGNAPGAFAEDPPVRVSTEGVGGWSPALAPDPEWMRHILPITWAAGMFLFMGTRAVMSVRYFLPIYPFLALCAAWALLKVWDWATAPRPERAGRPQGASLARGLLAGGLVAIVLGGTAAWAYGFTNVYRTENTRVRAARWMYQNIPGPINIHLTDGTGAEVRVPMPVSPGTAIADSVPTVTSFRPTTGGTLARVSVGFARNADDARIPGVLNVIVSTDPGGSVVLAEANVVIPATAPDGDSRGTPAEVAFAQPATVQADTPYYVLLRAVSGAPLMLSGATLSNENWDEYLPMPLDGYDPFGGIYVGRTMEMHWADAPNKRDMIVENLRQVDYILLQSQRRLWASTRIPATYPMTMAYYKALFDGSLGYELVGEFQNPIAIGPLQVSDAAGTVAWGHAPDLTPDAGDPFNNNIFAAEEAFTVYDHAPVWIFRKRADFDLAKATAILDSVDLSTVVVQGPLEASRAGTLLKLPADLLAIQQAGGTWSQMFDLNGLLNTQPWLAVIAWYLLFVLFGVLALPLTQVAFKGLADGGYSLARSVGLLVVAWIAWISGSLRVLPFTQGTIAVAVVLLAVFSGVIAFFRRRELAAFLRDHWKHILLVEGLALVLFVGFLLVRLGNPDLWHPSKGGEKPMDFSYFNAVLKSTFFPPYDPWYAGGYLNYYYYGFVLMGIPTKLLGVMPSLAYNLILPTFYALLGLNAFGVAFNLVARGSAGAQERASAGTPAVRLGESPDEAISGPGGSVAPALSAPARPRPSAYLAGGMAVLLMCVLGNLGQLYNYFAGFQAAADPALVAAAPNDAPLLIFNGFYRVVTAQASMATPVDWWYWNASRILGLHNGFTSDFSEFPLFSFLYGDPHAHMAALPFAVLALAWALAYLQGFTLTRNRWEWAVAFAIGGLTLGVLRPTNTWDYPMYLAVTVVAVGGAWLWHRRVIDGPFVVGLGVHLGLVIGLSLVLYRPFDQWFVPAYTELKRFDGPYTAMLGYLYWYGLFLFLFGSFVVSETGRWLSDTPARILGRVGDWFMPVMIFVGGVFLALAALLVMKVQIAWISWPLLVAAGLLAFRGRDRMSLEKRTVFFLLGTGMAVTIFVELFTLGGDRMNTIFKLYVQVWVLFAIGGAAALAFVWADRATWWFWKGAHAGVLILLLAVAGLYPVTAIPAKVKDRFPPYGMTAAGSGGGCDQLAGQPVPYSAGLPEKEQPVGLDGMQFMTFSAYCDNGNYLPLSYDYDAIRWLQQNVQGSPVIVEAQTFDLYRMSSRYAWFTGLPDVVGWDWHQRQQRNAVGSDADVTQRGRDVTDFYCAGASIDAIAAGKYGNCADILQYADGGLAFAQTFLRHYNPKYIIVGPMERSYYPAAGLDKFERMTGEGQLRIAYQNPGVTIYEVISK